MNHSKSFLVVEGGKKPPQLVQKREVDMLCAGFKLNLERQKPQPKLPPPPVEDE